MRHIISFDRPAQEALKSCLDSTFLFLLFFSLSMFFVIIHCSKVCFSFVYLKTIRFHLNCLFLKQKKKFCSHTLFLCIASVKQYVHYGSDGKTRTDLNNNWVIRSVCESAVCRAAIVWAAPASPSAWAPRGGFHRRRDPTLFSKAPPPEAPPPDAPPTEAPPPEAPEERLELPLRSSVMWGRTTNRSVGGGRVGGETDKI